MIKNGKFMTDNLRNFLNAEDLLDKYEHHVNNADKVLWQGSTTEGSIMGYAFSWGDHEGYDFWVKIKDNFNRHLRGARNA